MTCRDGWIAPSTEEDCEKAVLAADLLVGGCAGSSFKGDYGPGRGCYSYRSGTYATCGYWSDTGSPGAAHMGYADASLYELGYDDDDCLKQAEHFDSDDTCVKDWRDWWRNNRCVTDWWEGTPEIRRCCPETCASPPDGFRYKLCLQCQAGRKSKENVCELCAAGKYSGAAGASSCSACAAGTYSGAGASSCSACAAGEYSGGGASSCSACAAGTYSGAGASSCLACAAGTYSGAGASSCLACTAGKYSGEGQDTCTACAAGTYSTGGQAACTRCGGDGHYDQSFWDPNQSGLKSEDECDCAPGLTGTNCDQAECAATTALVSLGFLFLEVQWPRHARHLSRNEAFSGISAAFRAFDANGDDRLSVDEARAGAEVNTVIHRGGGHRSTLFPRRRGQG